jgi:hypothetical protein
MQIRTVQGVEVPCHGTDPRAASSELARWRLIRDAIRETASWVPLVDRQLFTDLMDAYAYAECKVRGHQVLADRRAGQGFLWARH